MDRDKLIEWKGSVNNLLKASRKLMISCNERFDRGFIGELLTLQQLINTYEAKLCSNADNNISYFGSSRRGLDIELLLNRRTIEINAKATTVHDNNGKPRWVRQNAKTFCIIENRPNRTTNIHPRTDYKNDFFFVFVDVKSWINTGHANFFVLSDEEAKKVFGKKYADYWNSQPIRESNSADMWVEYTDINDNKDNNLKRFEEYI